MGGNAEGGEGSEHGYPAEEHEVTCLEDSGQTSLFGAEGSQDVVTRHKSKRNIDTICI